MQKIIRHIQDPELPLRNRLFQLLSAIALAEYIIVSIYSGVLGGRLLNILVMAGGMLLFTATVTLTFRTGRLRLGSAISCLLYFSIYPLTFFASGGLYGGAPPVFAFALVYVFLVTEKWERAVCLAICVLGSAVCFAVAYLRPELLTRQPVLNEHVESMLSILLVTALLCALFAFVTEVYRAENRIVQRQKQEIEDLNRAQKRFFSSMSHEIRTPVNAIIGLNEMTLREDVSEEVRENAQNIEAAGKLLLHSINEIMDMSRLETGSMELFSADYQPTAMFSDIVGMVWLQAQEKGLELRIHSDPKLPSVLRGDEVRIKQILLNVVSNAVKYTKKGSVTLTVGSREEDGVFRMTYDVTDTGIGIRAESIPGLFTAFNRLDEEKNRGIEGTGLGLSIVKQLLDMMGGDIRVSSEYGKGSTFRIEIPQEVVDRTPIGAAELHRNARPGETRQEPAFVAPSLRILAVDDTPMNLIVVKKLLRDTGAAVDTAESGAEALQKTAEAHYDVILMDHQMPEMDGIECLHRIRAQEGGRCRDSRIVCLTANVGAEMEKLCLQEGFDGYLGKPVRGKTLEAELARLTAADA